MLWKAHRKSGPLPLPLIWPGPLARKPIFRAACLYHQKDCQDQKELGDDMTDRLHDIESDLVVGIKPNEGRSAAAQPAQRGTGTTKSHVVYLTANGRPVNDEADVRGHVSCSSFAND